MDYSILSEKCRIFALKDLDFTSAKGKKGSWMKQ